MWASIMSTADLAREDVDLDALASAARGFGVRGLQPPAGLPDAVALTKLANELFAAVPGQSLPTTAGPSQAGFGASPVEVAGSAAPHVASAATSSLPVSVSPVQVAQLPTPTPFDLSALDERVLDALAGALYPSALSVTGSSSLPGAGISPTQGGHTWVPDTPGS